MASSQKTILTLLFLNTILLLAPGLYVMSTSEGVNAFEDFVTNMVGEQTNTVQQFQEPSTWTERTAAHVTDSVGAVFNMLKMSGYLIYFLAGGVVETNLYGGVGHNAVELVIGTGLQFLRVTFFMLIVLEIIMLFRSEKTS